MKAIPELGTPDLDASKGFWRAAGFTVIDYDSAFAFAARDGVELNLYVADGHPGGVYLNVANVDELHREWSNAGLDLSEVRDEPWGMREFTATDPGGSRVRVGSNI